MKVTRKQILQAIRTESLKAGAWIHEKNVFNEDLGYNIEVADDNCKVCAVGAVLRQAGVDSDEIRYMGDSLLNLTLTALNADGDEEAELENKNYLGALSVKFEKLAKTYGAGKRTREKLAVFVKKNFPKTITF